MKSLMLLMLVVIPLAGAAIGAFVPARLAKLLALGFSLLTLAATIVVMWGFDFSQDLSEVPPEVRHARSVQIEFPPASTPMEDRFGLAEIGFDFHLGVDSISLWLVLLTVVLMPCALLASFESIQERLREYYAWMLVLLGSMNGVFIARDLLLFYVFFEFTLIPMFFIIGIWGGPERRYAAGKFFLFTFGASVFTLAAVIYLGLRAGSFDLINVTRFAQQTLTETQRWWVLLGLLAGLAVKVPLFPVHTWLPLAHTEAPTAGSVILAGVLLKLGTYGLLRLVVPIGLLDSTGVAQASFIQFLGGLCIVGIIYGALVAWVQKDIKKLVAYSSVSHLGFCVLGLIALNVEGMQGSVLYMINHGLSTGAMFLVIGMIYDRFHTRDIDELSGLARKMPRLAFFFVFFVLSSIGLPGLNGFWSEFLTTLGAFTSSHLGILFGVLAAIGVVLGALYMLHMTARVIFGPLKFPGSGDGHGHGHDDAHGHADSGDINAREIGLLIPIAAAVVFLGILPNTITRTIADPLELIRTPFTELPPVAATDVEAAGATTATELAVND